MHVLSFGATPTLFLVGAIVYGCTITAGFQTQNAKSLRVPFRRDGHSLLTIRIRSDLTRNGEQSHLSPVFRDSDSNDTTLSTRIRSLPSSFFRLRNKREQKKFKNTRVVVRTVHELRQQVLQQRIPLQKLQLNITAHSVNATTATPSQLANHAVLRLIRNRINTNSTPGNRADTAHLSLAIEGGGMRGSVSAGMAAAIASLGLSNAFDSIYGSSAGVLVGAYMISRQMCVDVYTQVLPAAGPRFASKGRVMSNVGVGYLNDLVRRLSEKSGATLGGMQATTDPVVASLNLSPENNNATTTYRVPLIGRVSFVVSRAVSKVPILKRTPKLLTSLRPYFTLHPGMNLTFVLDGIMNPNHGLRPFDVDSFRTNDRKQPLYAVSSTVRGGKLETVAFNAKEGDFFDMYEEEYQEEPLKEGRLRRSGKAVKRMVKLFARLVGAVWRKSKNGVRKIFGRKVNTKTSLSISDGTFGQPKKPARRLILNKATECPENSGKKGLFACFEASMLVPGAAGPPVKLLRSKHRRDATTNGILNVTNVCFDAFCYEPIPYRSAVENGATHVLALRSRPDGCFVEVEPATYEKIVAPVYFRLNRIPMVGEFFESGGSQYRYLEDVLTLDEGLAEGIKMSSSSEFKGVKVPPTDILFGTKDDRHVNVDPDSWARAHLLPIILPANTPELPSLTQEKDEVLMAVRNGYATAFDVLAPIAGLNFDPATVNSKRIAEMIFPSRDDEAMYVLENPVKVKGDVIVNIEQEKKAQRRFVSWIARKRQERKEAKSKVLRNPLKAAAVEAEMESPGIIGGKADSLDWLEAEALLAALPGFRGKLDHLAGGLRSQNQTSTKISSS